MTMSRTLCFTVATFVIIAAAVATPDADAPTGKRKRQIFREQVLPHAGGKIPGDAFRADRLALNRLNKDGISIPDGVLLDARRHDKHPHTGHNSDLEASVIKVVLTPDGRYVPPEGRYHDDQAQTIDSTYIIRPPIGTYAHVYRRPKQQQLALAPIPAKLEIPADVGAPTPLPVFKAHEFGFATPSNFVFQSHDAFFPDYFHPFYSAQNFPPFESFFHEFNQDRFARQADRNRIKFPTDAPSDRSQQVAQQGTQQGTHQGSLKGLQHPQQKQRELRGGFKPSPIDTTVNCQEVGRNGEKMFADVKKKCQEFYVCRTDGRKEAFICPKGTLFNDALRRCDWWQNVRCR